MEDSTKPELRAADFVMALARREELSESLLVKVAEALAEPEALCVSRQELCESNLVKAAETLCERNVEAVRSVWPGEAALLESAYERGELPQLVRRMCAATSLASPGELEAVVQSQEMRRLFEALKKADPVCRLATLDFT